MNRRTHSACLGVILVGAIAITWAQGLTVGTAAAVAMLSVVVFEGLVIARRRR